MEKDYTMLSSDKLSFTLRVMTQYLTKDYNVRHVIYDTDEQIAE